MRMEAPSSEAWLEEPGWETNVVLPSFCFRFLISTCFLRIKS